jgi:hypothetical protein
MYTIVILSFSIIHCGFRSSLICDFSLPFVVFSIFLKQYSEISSDTLHDNFVDDFIKLQCMMSNCLPLSKYSHCSFTVHRLMQIGRWWSELFSGFKLGGGRLCFSCPFGRQKEDDCNTITLCSQDQVGTCTSNSCIKKQELLTLRGHLDSLPFHQSFRYNCPYVSPH